MGWMSLVGLKDLDLQAFAPDMKSTKFYGAGCKEARMSWMGLNEMQLCIQSASQEISDMFALI
eukprot:1151367-Pelagomonas_calceolata.AAC.1